MPGEMGAGKPIYHSRSGLYRGLIRKTGEGHNTAYRLNNGIKSAIVAVRSSKPETGIRSISDSRVDWRYTLHVVALILKWD